ncbi:MAG: hypothetical protein IE937_05665 [Gammaproteobacteria bacterium]|nr:hypothetical protein [Gammaproteobacteria bacterium]
MTIQYEGGYFLFNEPLVRGYGANGHTANDLSNLSEYAVEAVNHIQETPWKVNPFILDVLKQFMEAKEDLIIKNNSGESETILRVNPPLNPWHDPEEPTTKQLPKEVWEGMSREDKQQFKKRRAKALKRYEKRLGVYRATQRIYDAAVEMSEFEHFYFPHNMDFRTRIYPIPTDLNPQSNDLSKGLLEFARPTRLGKDGLFWMGFTVASHWGEDKLSPEARYQFALKMLEDGSIQKWVDEPTEHLGWLTADKPWQFLAAAYEWVWAHRLPEGPEAFLSYLPGNLDGSCNGAQHLSIMSRDLVGATATNCRAGLDRNDLYLEVADRVWKRVQKDAEEGLQVAIEWVPKLQNKSDRRKVVKRSVMTVPYGVTEYGVADFMIKDEHVSDSAENQWDSARYMRDLIMASIDETMEKGRELQRWFQACAVRCAEAGKPLVWDTPAGSKVTQAYRNVIQKRITGFATRFYIYEEQMDEEDDCEFYSRIGMNEKKMGTSAPPNVVHSCDASHLQITTCRMADAGIKDFSMIHDSFGCPFAYVGLMRDILRQTVVDMYGDGYLHEWKASVEWYSGLTMPEPPTLGDFDINEILSSEFFFS